VVEGGRVAGIFTERDALFRVLAEGLDADSTPVAQVMTADLFTVPADTSMMVALHHMHDGGFRHVPVVEGGRPLGVVSLRDALGVELTRFTHEVEHKAALHEIVA
jgi:CBS domain-containing protein